MIGRAKKWQRKLICKCFWDKSAVSIKMNHCIDFRKQPKFDSFFTLTNAVVISYASILFCSALHTSRHDDILQSVMLLAPQSGALRINAYRDFHPIPSHPIPNPLIAFEHLSLYTVF